MPYLLPCCTNSKPHSTDSTPHNSYSYQQSVCPNCCPFCLALSPTEQTVHHTITIVNNKYSTLHVAPNVSPKIKTVNRTVAIEDNSQSVLYIPCCTNRKTHIKDGTIRNSNSDQQSVCLTCCPDALTVRPTVQTLNCTIAIVTNSKTEFSLALSHKH